MSYKKPEKTNFTPQVEWCQINNCRKEADVTFDERHGPRVRLCARHYMDHVDAAGKGAVSEKFNAAMERERENQEILGHRAYNDKAFQLLRSVLATYGART